MAVARPTVDEMYCSNCGAIIKRQSEFCSKCGVEVAIVSAPAASAAVPGTPQAAEAGTPGPDEMYCSSCGAVIKRRAEICVKCGVRVSVPPAAVSLTEFSDKSRLTAGILSPLHAKLLSRSRFSDKSRLTAGILGILLGALGVHRFYLGNVGIGVLQIVVSLITLGIGSLWGFIEGIIIIAGENWKDAQGRPLRKYNE